MVCDIMFNCIERFYLTRSSSIIPGFGRKMYTDYEIVCKVRTPSEYHLRLQAFNIALLPRMLMWDVPPH